MARGCDVTELTPRGRFSLKSAAEFRFGPTEGDPPPWDGAMRLAFALDDGTGHAGAVLRQSAADEPVSVELALRGGASRERALAQVRRTLCLDQDGISFEAVGERDPILAALQRALPGQRPVLFPSPYEAAAWSVLSARWPLERGARVRADLARRYGETFQLAGIEVPAFPTPDQLAALPDEHPDLSARKLARLRGVAHAGRIGDLDVERLVGLGPEIAHEDVQRLEGIGPFYATLIVLRACGFTDAWLGPAQGRIDDAVERYYGTAEPETVAENWRPFRTWALVLTRIAAHRDIRLP